MPLDEARLAQLACGSHGLRDPEALIRTIYDREAQFYTTMAQTLLAAAIASLAALSGVVAARQANLIDDAALRIVSILFTGAFFWGAGWAAYLARLASGQPQRLFWAMQTYNVYAIVCRQAPPRTGEDL